jgi:hypothetical protein
MPERGRKIRGERQGENDKGRKTRGTPRENEVFWNVTCVKYDRRSDSLLRRRRGSLLGTEVFWKNRLKLLVLIKYDSVSRCNRKNVKS